MTESTPATPNRPAVGFLPYPLLLLLAALVTGTPSTFGQSPSFIHPPGFHPADPGVHAIVGAKVRPEPGVAWTNATIVVRHGRIESAGPDVKPPADARIWDGNGLTVYAGLVEPYLVHDNRPASTRTDTNPANHPPEGASNPVFFGVTGHERDPGSRGPGHGLPDVTPEHRVVDHDILPKTQDELRKLGFTAAHLVPDRGIVRGQSTMISLGDNSPNASVIKQSVAQCIGLNRTFGGGYPTSLMGILAVVRQAGLDARHAATLQAMSRQNTGPDPLPVYNAGLVAMESLHMGAPVFLEPGSVLMAHRIHKIARELGWNRTIIVASGQEWRRADLIRNVGAPFVVPVNFPALPQLPDEAWEQVDLDQLRAWNWAPENPALLRKLGREVALTTHQLRDLKSFRTALREAINRGLSEDDALEALTTLPARLCGVADQLGIIAPGRRAHLLVVEGSYFDPKARIAHVWVDGAVHEMDPARPAPKKKNGEGESEVPEKKKESENKASVATGATDTAAPSGEESKASPTPEAIPLGKPEGPGKLRLARDPLEDRGPWLRPSAVLVRNATVWTSGSAGTIEGAHLLIVNGKIAAISTDIDSLDIPDDFHEIDGTGRHITPGLIDAHSHSMIMGGVNEVGLPSTAMVRIADVINSEADTIQQQLAGGLTIAHLLHGSANPIGGQSAVIKLRSGAGPDELQMQGAPPGIKFALGENVKQSNREERSATRFPQSRMGVPTFYVNRFRAAQEYQNAWQRWTESRSGDAPPRRDLELEALLEILEGRRLIHCHSYRQDEILVFLRTMESFGIRVATLQHVLEGYKVADEIARHGAGASAFSDWWAYKYEVVDAIPYAGSLMAERGVRVSFNSDSDDHARRMNLEAAKAVKYGDTSEIEALKFVTLNPAIQLKIDDRVGSLEVGKDADFAIWSGHPLKTTSICLETWIDGLQYFDRSREHERVERLREEREQLIARARQNSKSDPSSTANSGTDGEAASEGGTVPDLQAARAAFFLRALETSRHLGVMACEDCLQPY